MQDLLDTESWHELITLDKNMAADARNIGLSYTEDGFNAKWVGSRTRAGHVPHCACIAGAI